MVLHSTWCQWSTFAGQIAMTIQWENHVASAMREIESVELPSHMQLPALPHAVARFIELAKNDNSTMRDLAKVVETDTGLTMELLRHVNSAFIGLRQKAKTVQQALSLLGIRQSKLFLVAVGVQAAVQAKKSRLINQKCFWNSSLQKAIFSREVATLLKVDSDLAFSASLLSDCLLPLLTNDLFPDYDRFVTNRDSQPENMCDFEREHFGWDHAQLAALVAHRWKLPADMVCCLYHHHMGLKIFSITTWPARRRFPSRWRLCCPINCGRIFMA